MWQNVGIVLVVAALVVGVWAIAFQGDSQAEKGAKEWCGQLAEKGLLHEPMSQCLREYEQNAR